MKLVGVNAEVSTPASPTTVKNGFAGCISMDAHETESVLTKNPGLFFFKHLWLVTS
jgi:hypothetical protein